MKFINLALSIAFVFVVVDQVFSSPDPRSRPCGYPEDATEALSRTRQDRDSGPCGPESRLPSEYNAATIKNDGAGRQRRQTGAILGGAAAVVGLADSYKNNGTMRDVVDKAAESAGRGELDKVEYGTFGGDGSF